MKVRHIIFIFLAVFSLKVLAEEHTGGPTLELSKAPVDYHDIESIKRGAKFFAANCMSCHTLQYLKYDKIAKETGVTQDKMPYNVKSWPYGVQPPDLSLRTSIRGADWVYTYLHSFYQDSKRPTGANNLLLENTAMPNILSPFQGDQVLSKEVTPDLFGKVQYYDLLTLTREGTMTPDEFDKTIGDLVNFLAYAAEPYKADQERLGWFVLGFLAILFVFMYALKKEYWRDVKKKK